MTEQDRPGLRCRQCGRSPTPRGCTVTCGESGCQEAEFHDNAARARTRVGRRAGGVTATRQRAMGQPPSKGDVVYRVVDDGDSLRVQQVEVAAVHRNGDVVLARPFVGMIGVRHKADAVGRLFFASRDAALVGFARRQQEAIDSMIRRTDAARLSIAWAHDERASEER